MFALAVLYLELGNILKKDHKHNCDINANNSLAPVSTMATFLTQNAVEVLSVLTIVP